MDRTHMFAEAVRRMLWHIVKEWKPDRAELHAENDMVFHVDFTWPPENGQVVRYQVKITRIGPVGKISLQEEHGQYGVIS